MTYKTKAWVLNEDRKLSIRIEDIVFSSLDAEEVLVKPIYGCFEGNMLHAIDRKPINVCTERKEKKVILGNAGVVLIEKTGASVSNVEVGQYCLFFCNGQSDAYGFPKKIAGYDCPGSIGLFSKLTKVHYKQLIPVPKNSNISLQQWAAFSLRYITAWSNWKVAHKCLLSQIDSVHASNINVIAWGGGVAFAELTLANYYKYNTFMVTSQEARCNMLKKHHINPINRNHFRESSFDLEFIRYIDKVTNNLKASIFVDNIGGKLFNLTLKCLGRQGVLATSGWKDGALLPFVRSMECINRHIFVHTHYAKYQEGIDAVDFASKNSWVPELDNKEYSWNDIPELIEDYRSGKIKTYFPIFSINDVQNN